MRRLIALTILFVATNTLAAAPHWVGTWAAAPFAQPNPGPTADKPDRVLMMAAATTLRQTVHVSIGGSSVHVVLTNELGLKDLAIGGATISAGDQTATLTFSGEHSVIIPAGAALTSDAVALSLTPLSNAVITLYLPVQTIPVITYHAFANTTNQEAPGDQLHAATLEGARPFYAWRFLKAVEVDAPENAAAVVTFGDSITDGATSTRDANRRWPDVLAARLHADKRTTNIAVLNDGIGGNRVLHDNTGPNALARFDRDVLGLNGVKYVVLMEGINDIGHTADPDVAHRYDPVSAAAIIAGLAQLARRAHAHGLIVYGATLTPYGGAKYASPEGEAIRTAVNAWIRSTNELDGVIDFDKVTRDPKKPDVLLPAADSGDHLHPTDTGYKMMGESLDLSMFTKK